MDELLRQLVAELGVSRSQFAKDIHMDRSQTVKIINGNLPVSRRFYRAIMSAGFIGDDFKQKFAIAYGENEEVPDHWETVERFLERIKAPDLTVPAAEAGWIGRLCALTKDALLRDKTVYAVCGENPAVENALLRALRETGSDRMLRFAWLSRSLAPQAVDDLFGVFSFALAGVQTCIAEKPFFGAFPYAVCSEAFAVLFDDAENAVFSEDAALCAALTQKYARLAENGRKIVSFYKNEAETLTNNESFVSEKGGVYLNNHFPPYPVIDEQMLREAANPELPADARDLLIKSVTAAYRQRAEDMAAVYITGCAVEEFARTGRFASITKRYIRPFPPEHRIRMLLRLREQVLAGRAFIIKTGELRFSGDISINSHELDFGVCGSGMREDLYCAHVLLSMRQVPGLEGLLRGVKSQLPVWRHTMSKTGAVFFLDSVISSLRA